MDWFKFKYQLRVVFKPTYWLRIKRINLAWDKELWGALIRGDIEYVGEFSAVIAGHNVWIENHPYASGTIHLLKRKTEKSCSRATALLLSEELPKALLMQKISGIGPTGSPKTFTCKDGSVVVL
jgi:hypothetical protein